MPFEPLSVPNLYIANVKCRAGEMFGEPAALSRLIRHRISRTRRNRCIAKFPSQFSRIQSSHARSNESSNRLRSPVSSARRLGTTSVIRDAIGISARASPRRCDDSGVCYRDILFPASLRDDNLSDGARGASAPPRAGVMAVICMHAPTRAKRRYRLVARPRTCPR